MANILMESRNVNGLGSTSKRQSFFELFKASKANVFLIQETHSTKEVEEIWKTEWEGDIHFSHGTSNTTGVAILIKKNTPLNISNISRDNQGRYIIIETLIGKKNTALCNLYAPNDDTPEFFTELKNVIDSLNSHEFIMGGDWNVALDNDMDRFGTTTDRNPNARDVINAWILNNEAVDVFRVKNPNSKKYTYIRKRPFPHGRRLDYFLISTPLLNSVVNSEVNIKVISDHAPVTLKIVNNNNPRGNGHFKLNTEHFRNIFYVNMINDVIQTVQEEHQNDLDPQQLWEFLKYKIREKSIAFGA